MRVLRVKGPCDGMLDLSFLPVMCLSSDNRSARASGKVQPWVFYVSSGREPSYLNSHMSKALRNVT